MDRRSLQQELAVLRRGRGMYADDIDRRVGHLLRELCGIHDTDNRAVVRQKLSRTLAGLAARLPPDLGLVASASFGLRPEDSERFLQRRLERAGDRLERDLRTVRRYADEALQQIVDLLLASPAAGTAMLAPTDSPDTMDEWHTEKFSAIFRLDRDRPEVFELRRIMVTAEQLSQLEAAVSLPRPVEDPTGNERLVTLDLLYGGRVAQYERIGESHFRWTIELAQPVQRGGHHDYGLHYCLPSVRAIVPRYVYVPMHPCRSFQVVVKFDPTRPPRSTRKVSAAPPRVLDDTAMFGEAVEPDRLGELAMEFRDLRQGLAYGVLWEAA